jgi:hypothetical protein
LISSIITLLLPMIVSSAAFAVEGGWQQETRLTNDDAVSFTAANNCKWLAVDLEGTLHVVWLDNRYKNYEIFRKIKVGGIWLPDERVTNASGTSDRPNLAVDELGRLHLVWNDDRDGNMEIYHRIWNGSWSAEQRVTNTSGDSFGAAIVADGNTIHMVYLENVSGHLQVMYRTYENSKWSSAIPLTNASTGDRQVPTIAIGPDGSLHVAWGDPRQDAVGANEKIYYRKKSGAFWLGEEVLTDPANIAMRPNIAVDDSGFVHIAWIDAREPYEQIYYRRCGPSGWESEIALTRGSVTHYHPSIAAAGGEVFLAYWQNLEGETNSEVYFRRCVAGSWTSPTRISNAAGKSELPCLIAEPNRNLHLAWVDSRDGNEEIYYREYIDPQNGTGGGDDARPPWIPVPLAISSRPNPFSASTDIELSVPQTCLASVSIYDVNGRCVRKLFSRTIPRGAYAATWDGRDDAGRAVAPGVYFVLGRAAKQSIERKIILLK